MIPHTHNDTQIQELYTISLEPEDSLQLTASNNSVIKQQENKFDQ